MRSSVRVYRYAGAYPFLAVRIDKVVVADRVPRHTQTEDEIRRKAVLRQDHQIREVRARRLHYPDLTVSHHDQSANAYE